MTDALHAPKRRRWRWLACGIVVVLIVGCLGFVWLATPVSPRVVFTTSDGHQVTFLAAGLGQVRYSSHPSAYRSCYQFLQRYVPASLFKRLPVPKETSSGSMQSRTGAVPLIMLFEVQPIPPSGLTDVVQLDFADAQGHRFPGIGKPASRTSGGWEGTCFESFPRRDRMLVVHLTEVKSPERTVRFEIPNPGLSAYFPEWTADELPQTKQESQVVVTLPKADASAIKNGEPLPFEVTILDPAWKKHLLTSWVEDATGNYGNALSSYGTPIKSNGVSPFETVWKARAVLARTDPAVFTVGEKRIFGPFALLGSIADIPIPEPSFGGTEITSVSLQPARTRGNTGQPQKPGSTADVARLDHQFLVRLSGFRRNATLIAVVEDQTGRQLKHYSQTIHTTVPGAKHSFGFRFTPQADTTQVSLTLIVSEPKEFEFFFAPPAELRAEGGRQQ